ncbi:hypothetical protein SYJ56_05165 [Algoriphagus sp. D3-2-R+10]|uniref:hypothetical protein n=1 Tax=Algoriphagus aurantiacus TaxID=3103948 RepID=UPI002B3A7E78|nr:hypothetical protein [Algoriphagus sp. D3-2-R+10]MEB2774683.1 hypothetical protein [Algoriphagus sp. D3-2-R+10]
MREAVEGINSDLFEFFIMEQFEEFNVSITGDIEKSLTATGQGHTHNLLLGLPDCP